jgi:hypothetical protein
MFLSERISPGHTGRYVNLSYGPVCVTFWHTGRYVGTLTVYTVTVCFWACFAMTSVS